MKSPFTSAASALSGAAGLSGLARSVTQGSVLHHSGSGLPSTPRPCHTPGHCGSCRGLGRGEVLTKSWEACRQLPGPLPEAWGHTGQELRALVLQMTGPLLPHLGHACKVNRIEGTEKRSQAANLTLFQLSLPDTSESHSKWKLLNRGAALPGSSKALFLYLTWLRPPPGVHTLPDGEGRTCDSV